MYTCLPTYTNIIISLIDSHIIKSDDTKLMDQYDVTI